MHIYLTAIDREYLASFTYIEIKFWIYAFYKLQGANAIR